MSSVVAARARRTAIAPLGGARGIAATTLLTNRGTRALPLIAPDAKEECHRAPQAPDEDPLKLAVTHDTPCAGRELDGPPDP